LRDDLGPGGALVGVAIDGVLELVGPHRAGQRLRDTPRFVVVIRVVGVGHGFDDAQIRAERAQRGVLFGCLIVGHHDDGAITARVAHQCEADAGVACGAFDHDAARAQQPAGLEVGDNSQRRAVFHLPRISRPTAAESFGKRISGVLPIAPQNPSRIALIPVAATPAGV
jgi:hypothetical protein